MNVKVRCLDLIKNTIEFCNELYDQYPNSELVHALLFLRLGNVYGMGQISKQDILDLLRNNWVEYDDGLRARERLEMNFLDLQPTENNFELLETNPDGFVHTSYELLIMPFKFDKLLTWPVIKNGDLSGRSAN